ncbi:MAG: TonB family protein [Pedobacter sp.]
MRSGFPAKGISGETVHLSEVNVKDDGNGKVYDFVSLQSQPTFPGGMDKFYQYVINTIQYPQEAKDKKVTGKVFLSFVVETDGELSDIKIERSLGNGTDEEAVRVLKASPKWIPGIQDGQKVRVKYNIPISFSLSNPTSSDLNGSITPSPLIFIDGVKQKPSKEQVSAPLTSMVKGEIASMKILADEETKKLYGTEGQYGVIMITTKEKAKKP